ncbi:hypothetical protein E1B28_000304 [Marasmius oreades]|uniref:Uncharacterized protein n=1 Tax=Marasmius oreades TaxID=181124 RepID=A0A9P7V181_9AGAR|nr:uncharacterized protein E1B28_000304 [Marasmius oreades]KAG7098345.1 hypothetical protein E1B28_000304 [Marasmius oreades]
MDLHLNRSEDAYRRSLASVLDPLGLFVLMMKSSLHVSLAEDFTKTKFPFTSARLGLPSSSLSFDKRCRLSRPGGVEAHSSVPWTDESNSKVVLLKVNSLSLTTGQTRCMVDVLQMSQPDTFGATQSCIKGLEIVHRECSALTHMFWNTFHSPTQT